MSQEIWADVLAYVRKNVSDLEYTTWFAPVKPLGVQEGSLLLGVRNSFTKDWFRDHYLELLLAALRSLGAEHPQVEFQVLPAAQDALLLPNDPPPAPEAAAPTPKTKAAPTPPPSTPGDNRKTLNPKYTFENFVVGPNNNLAHAAALAVAESPGKAYNPLFIYGDVGLGKTHLMHAVGHYLAERFPEKRIEYVSTETFTNELINAIRDDKTTQFRNRYRSVDLLLVDDIQFLAGKERTQEEFFHTFNALYESNKQIILSSDRPPKDIQTLEGRLRSRFEWGLITDIQSPEYETRVAILKMNAEQGHITIPQEVLELIARQVTSNIRELEGALMRVVAFASLNNVPFSRAAAAKALSNVFAPQEAKVEMTDVLRQVAAHYGTTPDLIRGSGRARDIVVPRQVAQYLIRALTDHSLPEIGQFFGRDHSTVMHAVSKITEQMGKDPELAATVNTLRNRIQGKEEEEEVGA
ncbi:chromosomal replication initiator protein DnaA [Deinococcus radiodurans]|uniref:Chromosomal replication initiator protein DnaA n=1 Tax=Deinococcus radiodurans (strain ATCC 13939 / DSM 20539 / JCM 16871 / CCUG 27074 / LMG 4051 / NBRC 15346 / NCIMB 9279 / VKM B-1422 / R1) TaxID=243230 RepID=DNAA_DEIRA|nr:chromosomal replication initiator protein DnaA [Deinococcus radiodurans]Q9RYE7.2 RecName: Full=Chromosomal replication initiator protein DnaA [Deinococcus radiodurans R1 = ATCC 13939 = DSM 20539]ANC70346.1 chromosomal replication initiation protein DnaA [Deinococcus radiodurans R1 = ATCC 13939 = DSM 20539]QEM71987.1 chromosomal replication initiator protein DnaA [Deinococcus radiodurans]QIP30055.1 chromosomal replication initiator protein DnaA [Deinococcus radiodurans]QIP32919.1 chromosomal